MKWGFAVSIFILVLILIIYGIFIEPFLIEINHLKIENSRLNTVLKGKIVIHLTDLHIRAIGRREKKVLEVIDRIKPDLIFLTGDYVQWKGDNKLALSFLSELKAPIGVWAVMGDYDYSNSRKSCLFCHEADSGKPTKQHNIQFLNHSMERLDLPNGSIWIGGVNHNAVHALNSKNELKPIHSHLPAIILSHDPFSFDEVDRNREVLMLSGDTHGGQIALPSWFWKILGYEKTALYSQGLFQQGKKKMYVSRGIGTSHIPMRIFRRPEIVVLYF